MQLGACDVSPYYAGHGRALVHMGCGVSVPDLKTDVTEKYPWVANEDVRIVDDFWTDSQYREGEKLAEGEFAIVYKTRDSGDLLIASKQMKREEHWAPLMFKKEYSLLKKINHPGVARIVDAWIDREHFYLNCQLYTGGELFDYVNDRGGLPDAEARQLTRQVVEAVAHLHRKFIVHRDLKPENIVFKDETHKEIVLVDFGDAIQLNPAYMDSSFHQDIVGTYEYLAPEAMRSRKGHEVIKSDMWSVGVLAYVMLYGEPPFTADTDGAILKKIKRCKIKFPDPEVFSEVAKDFILSLVKLNIRERFSAEQALKHEWLGEPKDEPKLPTPEAARNPVTELTSDRIYQEACQDGMWEDKEKCRVWLDELKKWCQGFVESFSVKDGSVSVRYLPSRDAGWVTEVLPSNSSRLRKFGDDRESPPELQAVEEAALRGQLEGYLEQLSNKSEQVSSLEAEVASLREQLTSEKQTSRELCEAMEQQRASVEESHSLREQLTAERETSRQLRELLEDRLVGSSTTEEADGQPTAGVEINVRRLTDGDTDDRSVGNSTPASAGLDRMESVSSTATFVTHYSDPVPDHLIHVDSVHTGRATTISGQSFQPGSPHYSTHGSDFGGLSVDEYIEKRHMAANTNTSAEPSNNNATTVEDSACPANETEVLPKQITEC